MAHIVLLGDSILTTVSTSPRTATHLVVSAGGNDALMQVTVLAERAGTVGNFPDVHQRRMTTTALMVFNDVIIRAAWAHGARILDLRSVCDGPACYANEIESSAIGSARIAEGLLALISS